MKSAMLTFMTSSPLTAEQSRALIAELDAVRGELRVTQVERDLLKEQLKAFQRRLFGAKSEARSADQRDLFLNEAEALAANTALPSQESDVEITVPGHLRKKPGRKPLDPALPRVDESKFVQKFYPPFISKPSRIWTNLLSYLCG